MTARDLAELTIRHVSTLALGLGSLALFVLCAKGRGRGEERWFLGAVDRVGTWVTRAVVISLPVVLSAHAYTSWYRDGRLWPMLGGLAFLAVVVPLASMAVRQWWRRRAGADSTPGAS